MILRRFTRLLVMALTLTALCHASRVAKQSFAEHRIAILFKTSPKPLEFREFLRSFPNLRKLRPLVQYRSTYFDRWKLANVEHTSMTAQVVEQLTKNPLVEEVAKIGEVSASSIEIPKDVVAHTNDPLSTYQWGYSNQGHSLLKDIDDVHSQRIVGVPGTDVGASLSNQVKLKRQIQVAIIDGGVDLDHPDLIDQIARNEADCTAEGRLPFGNKIKDIDRNGFAGDCMGWNFTGKNKESGDNRPYDDAGHGTHIAGIVAAKSDNGLGVRGFNNDIKVIPIKVLGSSKEADGSVYTRGLTDRITRGILYAVTRKADVINLSMGWPESVDTSFLREAVKEAQRKGIIVVAAAGNNGHSNTIFPCAYPGVICVGSVSVDGTLSDFSNFGSRVDILAPGEDILSAYPLKLDPSLFFQPGYEIQSGPSQATAYLSGLVAMLLGQQVFESPQMLLEDLLHRSQVSWNTQLARPVQGSLLRTESFGTASPSSDFFEAKKSARRIRMSYHAASGTWEGEGELHFHFASEDLPPLPELTLVDPLHPSEIHAALIQSTQEWQSLGNQSYSLKFSVSAKDLDFNRNGTIQIIEQNSGRKFFLDVGFFKSISDEELNAPYLLSFKSATVETNGPNPKLPLRTVQDLSQNSQAPIYYQVNKSPDKISISIWNLDVPNSAMSHLKNIEFPKAVNLLQFSALIDLPSGQALYLIQTLVKDGDKTKIGYTWLNSSFEPFWGTKLSSWTFSPEVTIPPSTDMISFVWKSLSKDLKVPVLYYIADGKVPNADQNPSLFVPKDTREDRHVYFLDPVLNESGVNLVTRIVDSAKQLETIAKQYGLNAHDVLSPLLLAPQSRKDQKNSTALIVWALKRRSGTEYLQSQLNFEQKVSHQLVPKKWFLQLNDSDLMFPLASEDEADLRSSFATFNSSQSGRIMRACFFTKSSQGWLADVKTLKFENANLRDPILGVLGAFIRQGVAQIILGTKYRFTVVTQSGMASSRELLRYSFLPGSTFQESFYPVLGRSEKNADRAGYALFQDLTQITGDGIGLINFSDDLIAAGAPLARAANNISIPINCTPQNPVQLFGRTHFVLRCENPDQSSELKMIPMNL